MACRVNVGTQEVVELKGLCGRKTASRKASCREEEAINTLILDHRDNGRKLARSILRRWRVRMPAEEIDSVVDLALCEAARRYSDERGASFMTFFFYHLRGHLVRAVARAAQANNVFLLLAQSAGIDTSEWCSVAPEGQPPVAPEYLLSECRDAETPESIILRQEDIDLCRQAHAKLDDLEKEIIARSFESDEPLVQIARTLGYSRCHISRVKKSALDRMKAYLTKGNASIAAPAAETSEVSRRPRPRLSIAMQQSTKRRSRRRGVKGRVRSSTLRAKAA